MEGPQNSPNNPIDKEPMWVQSRQGYEGVTSTPPPANSSAPKKDNRKLKKAILSVELIIVIIVVGLAFLGGFNIGRNTNPSEVTVVQETFVGAEGPRPASALDVERIVNSIGQDMSSLSEDEDFPLTDLTNRNLGL
jgi:hypothetical protein